MNSYPSSTQVARAAGQLLGAVANHRPASISERAAGTVRGSEHSGTPHPFPRRAFCAASASRRR